MEEDGIGLTIAGHTFIFYQIKFSYFTGLLPGWFFVCLVLFCSVLFLFKGKVRFHRSFLFVWLAMAEHGAKPVSNVPWVPV